MSLTQRVCTAALLAAVAGISLGSAAQAHGDHHHHHSHKKKKAYNKGYRKGYNKAVKQAYRHNYRTYIPVYEPMPLRVIVAPSPWVVPVQTYRQGTRINVGLGFNL